MKTSSNNLQAEFTRMVQQEKSTIYSICLLFAETQADADDLAQECLINLWNGFGNFEGRSNLRTWLYRICMNTCISFDRKRKQRKRHSESTLSLNDMRASDSADNAILQRQYRLLHDRIRRLGPFDRAIVLLWLEDLPYEEIATVVGISARNVGVRLLRIKEQLKNMD